MAFLLENIEKENNIMITLSVIIPCFNNGQYLKEMMDCCIRQTFNDWELIIVDDGSTDDYTPSVIQEYCKRDNRIKFFFRDREPKGSVVCRNIGFYHSEGKYIIHFDADDLISDTCFEKRVKFMDDNPDCDYATFPAKSFNDGEKIPSWDGTASYGVSKGNKDLLYYFLTADYPFSVWCNIYRRKSIEKLPWDEKVKIYTDFSFIVPCIFAGLKHKFSNLQEYDYYYRKFVKEGKKGINMCSNFVNKDKCDSTIYLFNKLFRQIGTRDDEKMLLAAFSSFIELHFERLLQTNDKERIEEFIKTIEPKYSDLAKTFRYLEDKVANRINGHWNQARLHFYLYMSFRKKYNKVMCYHELAKWVLNR